MRKAVLTPAAVLLLLLSLSCKNSFMYYPSKRILSTPASVQIPFKTVLFGTTDGQTLHGWWIPAQKARATVIFFHGNGGNISHRVDSIRQFHSMKLNVFIFDYRGYGRSSGSPSEKGTYRDALAAWKYITRTRQVPASKIILFGRSLGGAVAIWLAGRKKPHLLIAESTFDRIREVAEYHISWAPTGLIFGSTYNSKRAIQKVTCPIIMVHSPDDEIVPYRLGRNLYRHAPKPKHFIKIRGNHNSGYLVTPHYIPQLKKLIDHYTASR